MFRSILFLNSVSIFITNVLNSYLVNFKFIFYYLFFQGFSLALSIKSISSAFSFPLTFSVSMNLVTSCDLEVFFFMSEHLYADCMCLISLVGELNLMWVPITPFLRVCWQLSPWYGV